VETPFLEAKLCQQKKNSRRRLPGASRKAKINIRLSSIKNQKAPITSPQKISNLS